MIAQRKSKEGKKHTLIAKLDSALVEMYTETDSNSYYLKLADVLLLGKECEKQPYVSSFLTQDNQMQLSTFYSKLHSKLYTPNVSLHLYKRLVNVYIESSEQSFIMPNGVDIGKNLLQIANHQYNLRSYKQAEYCADKALLFKNSAEMAAELKVKCMREAQITPIDSAVYALALINLHHLQPKKNLFFNLLIEYLSAKDKTTDLELFAQDEYKRDSTDLRVLLLQGELNMNKKQWDNAIFFLEKAKKIDTLSVQLCYNLGISYASKAFEMREQGMDKKGKLTPQQRNEIKKVLIQAKNYLESVKEQHNHYKQLNWKPMLYMVYYALNERDKAKKVKALIDKEK